MFADSNQKARIAVVIPAHRVESHIAGVLRGIPEFVSWIVVVDDRSPDKTGEIVEAEARRDPRIRLVRHATNQGVGGAMLTGYAEARRLGADIVVKMDGDGQMDPSHMPALIKPILLGKADYTKGNRFLHARQLNSMPLVRRLGNLGLSFLTKLASGYWNVFDPTNGYTAMHASLIPMLNAEGIARRYFYESSMLLELSLLRAVIRDVYIPARYGDEVSGLSHFRTLLDFPKRLLRGFMRRVWIQYFVREFGIASVFATAGTLSLLFGVIFGSWQWFVSMSSATPASTGTVMFAVLPIILGVQLLLQAIVADVQNTPDCCLQEDAAAYESDSWVADASPDVEGDVPDNAEEDWPREKAA